MWKCCECQQVDDSRLVVRAAMEKALESKTVRDRGTSKSRIRRPFFSQKVVTDWNRLPQHVIEAPSTNAFKSRLDKFWQQDMSI